MKIVNVCISSPYIEGFSYQENILTDYFRDEGIETSIIGCNIFPASMKVNKVAPGIYFDNGKRLIRIKCLKISFEFIFPFNLYFHLRQEKPDVIFHHNLNCTALIVCLLYKINHSRIVLLVDNHTDYINCNRNKFYQLIYYKFLVRLTAKFSQLFVHKFYGVTPSRCDYLHEVYGVKQSKIDFLPIGADVKAADSILKSKSELRGIYDIPINAFIFVSGGKMGQDKGTDILIKAIDQVRAYRPNVFLVLFGSFNDTGTESLAKGSDFVIFKGWCDHKTSMCILKAADVAVWPVHHTTLIEDAISVNTPLIIRKTRTTEHLIDGNGIFLESLAYHELYSKIRDFIDISQNNPFEDACKKISNKLDYRSIVQKLIKDINE